MPIQTPVRPRTLLYLTLVCLPRVRQKTPFDQYFCSPSSAPVCSYPLHFSWDLIWLLNCIAWTQALFSPIHLAFYHEIHLPKVYFPHVLFSSSKILSGFLTPNWVSRSTQRCSMSSVVKDSWEILVLLLDFVTCSSNIKGLRILLRSHAHHHQNIAKQKPSLNLFIPCFLSWFPNTSNTRGNIHSIWYLYLKELPNISLALCPCAHMAAIWSD